MIASDSIERPPGLFPLQDHPNARPPLRRQHSDHPSLMSEEDIPLEDGIDPPGMIAALLQKPRPGLISLAPLLTLLQTDY